MSAHLVTMVTKENGDTDLKIITPEATQIEKYNAVKKAFEEKYGVDQLRTALQWRNLVETYGMAAVCQTEKMKEKEVKKKMNGKK